MPLVPQTPIVDLNANLRIASQRARLLTGATGVAIALAHKGAMICRASVGANAPSLGCRLDVTSGFSGECVRGGKALRCDDSETDPRVDLASCRRLGIRSILATPIRFESEIVGILEIFSPQPHAFDDSHVAVVRVLAESVFFSPPAVKPMPAPKLLVETEPAHRVFLRNLIDTLSSREQAPLTLTSSPAQFWSDVFVTSRLPWQRFGQSILLHIIMLAMLGSVLKLGFSQAQVVSPAFNRSDVLYYLPAEYVRGAKGKALSRIANAQRSERERRPLSVVREQRNTIRATITAPDIKLKRDIRLLRLTAWSSVAPAGPASAVMRTQLLAPATLVGVVGPPPNISAVGRSRALTLPTAAVVGPPPTVRSSLRRMGTISIGGLEVVSPAPQIPAHDQNSNFATVQASLRDTLTGVVGPPPSATSLKSRAGQDTGWMNASTQIVPPPPQVDGTGATNRLTHNNTGIPVVPPPPSPSDLQNTSTYASSLSSSTLPVVPPVAARPRTGSGTPEQRGIELATRSAMHPGEDAEAIAGNYVFSDRKELSVAVIGPVLPLPSSSYFSSSEIFVAEERLSTRQKRLIKLVYDFLPYQRRLSEYGPNYPDVDKLRVTRDVTCDETLAQATSTAITSDISASERQSLGAHDVAQPESKLPCFRTTADDYRRALARHHK